MSQPARVSAAPRPRGEARRRRGAAGRPLPRATPVLVARSRFEGQETARQGGPFDGVGLDIYREAVTRVNVALFLSLLIACSAPVHRGPTEVATQFLYFKKGKTPRDTHGGVGDLYVEVAANPNYRAPVRFAETTSMGVGQGWRSAVWMALVAASAQLGFDPLSIRVTVEADDAVDGPSAGALTTVAIMAAVRGETLLKDAIVTGTINPDLTIGPVGGIPEKVEAAVLKGKRRIGVPVGQTRAFSLRSRHGVDVVARARRAGARLFVIKDVADAYEVMTGVRLEPPVALTAAEMVIPAWAQAVFRQEAASILDTVEKAEKAMVPLFEKAPYAELKRSRVALMTALSAVRDQLKKGDSVDAIYAAVSVQGWHFQLVTGLLVRVGADLGRWEYVQKLLRSLQLRVMKTLQESVPAWSAYEARHAVEVPYVVDTFEALLHGARGLTSAQEAMAQSKVLRQMVEVDGFVPPKGLPAGPLRDFTFAMINAQGNLALGKAYFRLGKVWQSRAAETGPQIPDEVIRHLSSQYQRVADANLKYTDALLIHSQPQRGTVLEQRKRLMQRDHDYRQAVMNRRLPELMSDNLLSKADRPFAILSGAVSSYFSSATVISKHYSLNAVLDKDGEVVRFQRQAAFENMVELAELKARQAAARCRGLLGEVPVSALIEYGLGRRMNRKGSRGGKNKPAALRERLEALGHLWRSYTMSELAIAAHRHLRGTDTAFPPD